MKAESLAIIESTVVKRLIQENGLTAKKALEVWDKYVSEHDVSETDSIESILEALSNKANTPF